MRFLLNRIEVVSTYVYERLRFGTKTIRDFPMQFPADQKEFVVVLDGVGGFQFAPLLVRRVLRKLASPISTIMFKWQGGLVGEIFTDLMWHKRNRLQGLLLARKILAFKRAHADARIHIIAYSGGAGVSVFACEKLKGKPLIDTLVLACPAISPTYNLAPALRSVRRAYALTSHRDRYLLGIGTAVFGTTDRVRTPAAGNMRFRIPAGISNTDREFYARIREINWTEELRSSKHHGGHTGWLMPAVLEKHLVPILRGEPNLEAEKVQECNTNGSR